MLSNKLILNNMVGSPDSELARPIEQTRREKLSDEQLGNLISAVGNNSAKAITLLVMRDGNVYPRGDLHRTLLFCQGKEIGWNMSSITPFEYCTKSLAPIGLVTKETLDSDLSTFGYQITDYGKRIGIPFCGLILDWSTKHNISLPQLWGGTNSTAQAIQVSETLIGEEFEFKTRAPFTTLSLLFEIITAPDLPIRTVDLATRLGTGEEYISKHLQRLSAANIIDYQSTEANSSLSAYKLASNLPASEPQNYPLYNTLTRAVWLIYQHHPNSYLSIEDIYNLLPQTVKEHQSQDSFTHRVSGILAHLKRYNYLEIKKFSSHIRSEINLNEDQKIVLTELLEIVDQFQDQDPEIISKGKSIAEGIISNPSRVSSILRKAKEQSSQANKTSVLEITDLINYLIISHPGITNKEIQQLLEQGGNKLGISRIQQLTANLEAGYSVRTNKEGSVKRFFPKEV